MYPAPPPSGWGQRAHWRHAPAHLRVALLAQVLPQPAQAPHVAVLVLRIVGDVAGGHATACSAVRLLRGSLHVIPASHTGR